MPLPQYQFGSYTQVNYDKVEQGPSKYWTFIPARLPMQMQCQFICTCGNRCGCNWNSKMGSTKMFDYTPIIVSPETGLYHVIEDGGFVWGCGGSSVYGSLSHGAAATCNGLTALDVRYEGSKSYNMTAYNRYGLQAAGGNIIKYYQACKAVCDRCGCKIDYIRSHGGYWTRPTTYIHDWQYTGGVGSPLDCHVCYCLCVTAGRFNIGFQPNVFRGRGPGHPVHVYEPYGHQACNTSCYNMCSSGIAGYRTGCYVFNSQVKPYGDEKSKIMSYQSQWIGHDECYPCNTTAIKFTFWNETPEDFFLDTTACFSLPGRCWCNICRCTLMTGWVFYQGGTTAACCHATGGGTICQMQQVGATFHPDPDDDRIFMAWTTTGSMQCSQRPHIGYYPQCGTAPSATMLVFEMYPPKFNGCCAGPDGGGYISKIWPISVGDAGAYCSRYQIGGFCTTHDGNLIIKQPVSVFQEYSCFCCSTCSIHYPIPVICTCCCLVRHFVTNARIPFDLAYTCRCTWLALFAGQEGYNSANGGGQGWYSMILAEYDCDLTPRGAVEWCHYICCNHPYQPFNPMPFNAYRCAVNCGTFANHRSIMGFKLAYDPAEDSAIVMADLAPFLWCGTDQTCDWNMRIHAPGRMVAKIDADMTNFCNNYLNYQDSYVLQTCCIIPTCPVNYCQVYCFNAACYQQFALQANKICFGNTCCDSQQITDCHIYAGVSDNTACCNWNWSMYGVAAPSLTVICSTADTQYTDVTCWGWFCNADCCFNPAQTIQCGTRNKYMCFYTCGQRECGFCCCQMCHGSTSCWRVVSHTFYNKVMDDNQIIGQNGFFVPHDTRDYYTD